MVPNKRRYANFDVMRLCAASSVIFSHSFGIADGSEANELLVRLLGPGNAVGLYGVFVFFIMSGFLVSTSISRTNSLKKLLLRRIIRIYPALIVCAFICGFIIAGVYARSGILNYLMSHRAIYYVIKVLLLRDPLYISGVTYYHDTKGFGGIINGSLWTLLQEAQFYGLVVLLAGLRCFNATLAAIGAILGTLLFYLMTIGVLAPQEGAAINAIYSLAPLSAGVTMHFIYERIGRVRWIAIACILAIAAVIPFGLLSTLFPVLGAYPLVYLGTSSNVQLGNVTRFGDVTFGTYLYGWPIQQIIRSGFSDSISGYLLFAMSWPLAISCGWLSWHLIERHLAPGRAEAHKASKSQTNAYP